MIRFVPPNRINYWLFGAFFVAWVVNFQLLWAIELPERLDAADIHITYMFQLIVSAGAMMLCMAAMMCYEHKDRFGAFVSNWTGIIILPVFCFAYIVFYVPGHRLETFGFMRWLFVACFAYLLATFSVLCVRTFLPNDKARLAIFWRSAACALLLLAFGFAVEPLYHAYMLEPIWGAELARQVLSQPGDPLPPETIIPLPKSEGGYYGAPWVYLLAWPVAGFVIGWLIEQGAITEHMKLPASPFGIAIPGLTLMLLLVMGAGLCLKHGFYGALPPAFLALLALQLSVAYAIAQLPRDAKSSKAPSSTS